MEAGSWENALTMYAKAGEAGKEQLLQCHYLYAENLLKEGSWEKASSEFALSGEKGETRISEPYVTAGDLAASEGNDLLAVSWYAKAGKEGQEKMQAAWLRLAEGYMLSGELDEASHAFRMAGEESRIHEPYIRAAKQAEEENLPLQAASLYRKGQDLDSAKRVMYAYAEDLKKQERFDAASHIFSSLGDYMDAAQQALDVYMAAGEKALKNKLYAGAAAMFEKAGDQGTESRQNAYYLWAESLMKQEKWLEASEKFLSAGDYRDAADRASTVYVTAGDLELEAKNFEGALLLYKKAGDFGTEKTKAARYAWAESHLEEKAWDAASAEFLAAKDYLDAQERAYTVYVTAGDLELKEKNYEAALKLYEKAGDYGLEKTKALRYAWAESLAENKAWNDASTMFLAASDYRDAQERAYTVYVTAGDLELETKNYEEALKLYEKAGDYGTEKIKALRYAWAESLAEEKAWDEASAMFLSAGDYLDAAQRAQSIYITAGDLCLQDGNFEEAISLYARSELGETSVQKAWYTWAELLLKEGKWEESSEAFLAAGNYLDAESRAMEPFLTAGDLELKNKAYSHAISFYTRAGNQASVKKASYLWAEDLLSQQKWDEASRMFAQAGDYLDAEERALTVFREEGDLKLDAGAYQDAMEAYRKAGETGSEWILRAHYVWAENSLKEGAWAKAKEEFEKAGTYRDAENRTREPAYRQGEAYFAKKQYLEAADAFMRAEDFMDAEMKAGESWYTWALTMLAQEKYDDAYRGFVSAGSYLDAGDMAKESIYRKGKAAIASGDREAGYDALIQVRDYLDSGEILQTWDMRMIRQTRSEKRAKFQVGRNTGLGKFLQDAGSTQPETVEWMILCVDDNKVLLTTRYILTAWPFSSDGYMDSAVRTWLNDSFLRACFDGILLRSLIPQEDLGGDRVFLLSKQESEDYMANGPWVNKNRAAAKYYARKSGVKVRGENNTGSYWLRDAADPGMAWTVSTDGSYVQVPVDDLTIGVRPAVWLDLDVLYPQ